MDGMNETAGEEYILAMKTAAHREDSDLWRARRAAPLKPGESSNAIERRRAQTKNLLPMTDDHATKVLASLVPDEIIYNVDDYSIRSYNCCILFGDVSGFTDLCEMYNKTGKGGPSRLTTVLNGYIGAMVQEVISRNGDVVKFSGDAFLAVYKCSDTEPMQDVVHEALDAAIMIQKSFGTYETDVGVFLRVKLAISAGGVWFSIIGTPKNSYYVVVGPPIVDAKSAEKCSSAGEIIVASSAWNYVNPNEYTNELLPDGIHIKVKGVGLSWRPVQKNSDKQDKGETPFYGHSSSKGFIGSDEELDEEIESQKSLKPFEEFSIRPAVNYASQNGMKEDLRKFIITPIMRGIDLDEPIEYLTEMRQIVIVFINVVTKKVEWVEYVKIIKRIYIIIYEVVITKQGCINKMSTFDKDLMFVLLFGLRGYKNELESQMGLRCAAECQEAISNLPDVLTTSIGVTTGVTYCGVVGHTLRREYTVISLTVNKAARLMIAYPNKVTCDRETFLHSKLEASNFILQEPKALKGIRNVGPVYEFKEKFDLGLNVSQDVSLLPILGRNAEVDLYLRMLDECVEIHLDKEKANVLQLLNHHNTYLIKGIPRIGKTRLLEELIYRTGIEIPVNKFRLNKRDGKIPYKTIDHIFSTPLGLSEINSCAEREAKLSARLRTLNISEFLCALNQVFSVNFEMTVLYLSLSNQEKISILENILKQLCIISFTTLWVIAIDHSEFVDLESWNFIATMIELDVVLLVMAIGDDGEWSENAAPFLQHRRIRHVTVPPIDKWYHAGLICQILDVFAIPPELEKLIQTRSQGTPGWIESFLISLVQGGALLIETVSRSEIKEMGLVSPPLEMMMRVPNDKNNEDMRSESIFSGKEEFDNIDSWKMYKFSSRDVINMMHENMTEKNGKHSRRIPVCIIAPNFKVEDFDPEFSMDVMIIKMFDSLTSYEQHLLKCSAVLGEYFLRDMLIYIINSGTPRSAALAVKKLFELRVLGCARGDFTQGDVSITMYKKKVLPSNEEVTVQCDCIGNKIHDTCFDLPKYASCGYLKFKGPMFRNTTYYLLTDTQKKEYHARAIRYLEKETRRCRSCGNGFFVKILGKRYDEGFTAARRKNSAKSPTASRNSIFSLKPSNSDHSSQSRHQSVDYSRMSLRPTPVRKDTLSSYYSNTVESFTIHKQAHESHQLSFLMGFQMVNKLRYSFSLTRTFSYADFSSCQCPLILDTMYTQLLEHCEGAEFFDKMLETLLEYAYTCIISFNIPQALEILHDASLKLSQKPPAKEDDENSDDWRFELIKGKIETLTGHARLELGQMEDAYSCFQRALKHYGYSFPTKAISIKYNCYILQLKQRLGMYFCPSNSTSNEREAQFCDDVAQCLSLLCHLFKKVHMWSHAELAAAWSLNKSLESDLDFYGLCIAYANMLDISHQLKKQYFCVALEVHALKLLHRKKSAVEAQELKAVALLYGSIFCARTFRAEIDKSIHIGYIMLRICTAIHAVQISLQVLPILIQVLLIRRRLSEAISMILELDYYSIEDTDNSGRTWFYSLCLGYQLETGYTVVPFRACEKYYQIEGDTLVNIRDQDVVRRFITVMWLWCVRNDEWEAATIWYAKACEYVIIHTRDSVNNMFTSLYLLEGLLVFLVGKIDKRNVESISQAYKEIDTLINAIQNTCKVATILLPRFNHLKAYYKFIKNDEQGAFNILSRAKKDAEKQENTLELAWIEHSEKAWNNNLSAILIDFWKEHCEPDNVIDYHEVELNEGKLGLFTLPTPLYY